MRRVLLRTETVSFMHELHEYDYPDVSENTHARAEELKLRWEQRPRRRLAHRARRCIVVKFGKPPRDTKRASRKARSTTIVENIGVSSSSMPLSTLFARGGATMLSTLLAGQTLLGQKPRERMTDPQWHRSQINVFRSVAAHAPTQQLPPQRNFSRVPLPPRLSITHRYFR